MTLAQSSAVMRQQPPPEPVIVSSGDAGSFGYLIPQFIPAHPSLTNRDREVILWTRGALKAAGLIPESVVAGGGYFDRDGNNSCYAYEPGGGLLREPKVAVVVGFFLPPGLAALGNAAIPEAFAAEYESKLRDKGVSVYFCTPFAGHHLINPLAGPCLIQDAEISPVPFPFEPPDNPRTDIFDATVTARPTGGLRGESVYWAVLGDSPIATGAIGDFSTGFPTGGYSWVDRGAAEPDQEPVGDFGGFVSLTFNNYEINPGVFFRVETLRQRDKGDADAALLAALVPVFRKFRFTFWNQPYQDGADPLDVFPGAASDFFPAASYIASRDFSGSDAADLADDIASFFAD